MARITFGQVIVRTWRPRVFRWMVHAIRAGSVKAKPATRAQAWSTERPWLGFSFVPGRRAGSVSKLGQVSQLMHRTDTAGSTDSGPFNHGTKADLNPGDLLQPGYSSNYGGRKKANFLYLTATMDAAIWGAELAVGEGPGRIYRVKPTGTIEDDPNLTDKRFPGNPTRSYRTRQPLRVVSEVADWEGHPPHVLQAMLDHLEELKRLGIEAIND